MRVQPDRSAESALLVPASASGRGDRRVSCVWEGVGGLDWIGLGAVGFGIGL